MEHAGTPVLTQSVDLTCRIDNEEKIRRMKSGSSSRVEWLGGSYF